jgi:hypothetical protein
LIKLRDIFTLLLASYSDLPEIHAVCFSYNYSITTRTLELRERVAEETLSVSPLLLIIQ